MFLRRVLPVVVVAATVLSFTVAAGAAEPFPAGDDGVRYLLSLPNPDCGTRTVDEITSTSQVVDYEGLTAGDTYTITYTVNGDVTTGAAVPVAGTGSGTATYGAFSFGTVTYPATVSMALTVYAGGTDLTYRSTVTIDCSIADASADVTTTEEFFAAAPTTTTTTSAGPTTTAPPAAARAVATTPAFTG